MAPFFRFSGNPARQRLFLEISPEKRYIEDAFPNMEKAPDRGESHEK
jgi:hypothetical protein